MNQRNSGLNYSLRIDPSLYQEVYTLKTQVDALIKASQNTTIPTDTALGGWDADTNTPTLGNNGAGGLNGQYYIVSVSGTTTLDGISSWSVGDQVLNANGVWNRVPASAPVTSVNGKIGNVVITADDVGLGNVSNQTPEEILTNPTITGTVTVDRVIETPASFTGQSSVTLTGTGLGFNIIDNGSSPATATLPLNPASGSVYSILNGGTGLLTVVPSAPNTIESGSISSVLLPNNTDRVRLQFVSSTWIIL